MNKLKQKNGAQAFFSAMVDAGITDCFANPGTSEMQLVYEMGLTDDIQQVLCLQENVVTGACDGYNRMSEKPALALLHMGAGFANGLCNLHNARKAGSGMVVLCGDNADYHYRSVEHTMLTPIKHLAEAAADFIKQTKSADDLAVTGAQAARIAKIGQGKIAVVTASTNHHWEPTTVSVKATDPEPLNIVTDETIERVKTLLTNGKRSAIVLDKRCLIHGLEIAGQIAAATGVEVMVPTITPRFPRGEGRVIAKQIPYVPELAFETLKDIEQMILLGTDFPATSFAYQEKPIVKIPESCEVFIMATSENDTLDAFNRLGEIIGTTDAKKVKRQERVEFDIPAGSITPEALAQSLCNLIPENAIVVDESATLGMTVFEETNGARKHDWLMNPSGGGIGAGLPCALGAAVASPDRKILALQADGCGMYTPQTLWSIARTNCDMTIVILKNDKYAILQIELARVRESEPTDKMTSMLDIDKPSIDWVKMAESQGIPATSATTVEEFQKQLAEALAHKGPRLIEACIDQDMGPMMAMVARQ